ncbi:hypothetical protein I350_04436 [Cryptococcus amylolentus CBS 6273]|uniref:Uncharacterized protein n=1 Tax=Cryptococcus amylolentus CBS 6273 TaxID=1296118 RepID=A0A1E3K1M8_9TREE|nr:hypothetical protein I350_04436 [Cryptococcus amylolentus CBS 6273]
MSVPVTSYRSFQSCFKAGFEDDPDWRPSNFYRAPAGVILGTEPKEDRTTWPETGHPGPEITAFILSLLGYDSIQGDLSRKTVTVVRNEFMESCGTGQEVVDALEAANKMDRLLWERFDDEPHDWLAKSFEEGNTEALWTRQHDLIVELEDDYPNVQVLNVDREGMGPYMN